MSIRQNAHFDKWKSYLIGIVPITNSFGKNFCWLAKVSVNLRVPPAGIGPVAHGLGSEKPSKSGSTRDNEGFN
jgi:hypothetical protein